MAVDLAPNPRYIVRKVFDLFSEIGAFRDDMPGAQQAVNTLLNDKLGDLVESDAALVGEYLAENQEAGGGKLRTCLFCKSTNVVGSSVHCPGRTVTQYMVCNDCQGAWTDIYSLKGVLIESRPETTPLMGL